MSAYCAHPAPGHGPGVIVVHEAWGLDDNIRDVSDRLARAGFVVIAPDLYGGEVAPSIKEAMVLLARLDESQVEAILDFAVRELLNDSAVTGSKVGCVGFCAGGHIALLGAAHNPRIGAVVDCYGFLPRWPVELEAIDAAVLGVFGAEDEFIPRQEVDGLRTKLAALGKRATVHVVEGVGHAFLNETRPERFNARAASEIWPEILNFLRAELL